MKVCFTEFPLSINRDIEIEKSVCPPDTEFVKVLFDPDAENNDKFYEDIADADVIVDWYCEFGKKEIDAMKKCKCISFASTAYNLADLDYAASKGIAVCSILDYCTQETAENGFAMMLSLQRGLPAYHRSIQDRLEWNEFAVDHLQRVEGQTIGIVGLGRIGQSVVKKAHGFDMNVIAYDPYLPPEVADKVGAKLVDFETILSDSDVISIHMNLTPENTYMFNKDVFMRCKKKPIIINEGRGLMIKEDDLAWALDNGYVRAAGLDMLESEAPDLTKCKLVGRENVIINPHAGYRSDTSFYLMCKISMENALLCYQGKHKEAFVVRNGVGL